MKEQRKTKRRFTLLVGARQELKRSNLERLQKKKGFIYRFRAQKPAPLKTQMHPHSQPPPMWQLLAAFASFAARM